MVYEYLISESQDIYYNLALEEYIVRNVDLDSKSILLVYINKPAVVLGKNQNVFQEVNLKSFYNSDFKLARRISGGGTVVHDSGNINCSFFEPYDLKRVNNYENSVGRMVKVLNDIGIGCYMNERNAIFLNSHKKISGSAQFSTKKGILSHFTLLYDSDLDRIASLLKPNKYSIKTKASKSVSSEVDNIKNYTDLNQNEFVEIIRRQLGYTTIFEEDCINQSVFNVLYKKYSNVSFYFDKASDCKMVSNSLELDISEGKITGIVGINDPNKYLNQRLYPTEIPIDNPIWNQLLN